MSRIYGVEVTITLCNPAMAQRTQPRHISVDAILTALGRLGEMVVVQDSQRSLDQDQFTVRVVLYPKPGAR